MNSVSEWLKRFYFQELHPGSLSLPVVHPRRESNPLAQNLHGRPGGYFQ